jgi:hypothetical protein
MTIRFVYAAVIPTLYNFYLKTKTLREVGKEAEASQGGFVIGTPLCNQKPLQSDAVVNVSPTNLEQPTQVFPRTRLLHITPWNFNFLKRLVGSVSVRRILSLKLVLNKKFKAKVK